MEFWLLPTDILDNVFLRLTVDEIDNLLLLFDYETNNEIWRRLRAARYSTIIVCNMLKHQLLNLKEPDLNNILDYSTILSTLEFESLFMETKNKGALVPRRLYYILDSQGEREPIHKSIRKLCKIIKGGLCGLCEVSSKMYLFLEPLPQMTLIEEYLDLQKLNTIFINFILGHFTELRRMVTLHVSSGIFFNDSQRINFDYLSNLNVTELVLTHLQLSDIDELVIPRTTRKLNLSNNRLRSTENIQFPQNLKILDLSHNALASISGLNLELETCDLSFNHLDNSIFRNLPTSVKSLDLSYNKVTMLDAGALSHLDYLNIKGCNISITTSYSNTIIDS